MSRKPPIVVALHKNFRQLQGLRAIGVVANSIRPLQTAEHVLATHLVWFRRHAGKYAVKSCVCRPGFRECAGKDLSTENTLVVRQIQKRQLVILS